MRVEHVPTAALPRVTADHLEAATRAALDRRGAAHLGLSGGRTPWVAFQAFGLRRLPWERVTLWQVDERIARDGDPARNAVGIEQAFERLGVTLQLMEVEPPDAAGYARRLHDECDGVLDLVHLGLGPDGHTASWPPGDPVVDAAGDVAASGEYQGYRRLTLTPTAVNRARARLFLVSGDDKVGALRSLVSDDGTVPANRVTRADTLVLTDIDLDGP